MATLVEDWHTTAACHKLRPGMAATNMGQYVTTFHTVSRERTRYSDHDIELMAPHTWPRSARRGRIPTKTPTTMAGKRRARIRRIARPAPGGRSPPIPARA
jgi:hypothetical protein